MKHPAMKHVLPLLAAAVLAGPVGAADAPVVPTVIATAVTAGGVADYDGVLQPVRQATVTAQVGGNVLALEVRAGDSVKRGQLLVRIDARESRAVVARSDAAKGNKI